MAYSHYVMDLYFSDPTSAGGLRREVLRIEASSVEEALAEGRRIDAWKKTHHYDLRAIHKSAKTAGEPIYSSAVDNTAPGADFASGADPDQAAALE